MVESGLGNGVVGKSLNPSLTDMVSFLGMSMLSDALLFWSISAGGINFKSAMHVFEKVLSENMRRQIITYLRQL